MDPNRSKVRKNLFGPVDHAAVQRDLERETQELEREDTERMRRKYNFDPKSGNPCREGQWKWEVCKEETRHNTVDTEIKDQEPTEAEESPTQQLQTPAKN